MLSSSYNSIQDLFEKRETVIELDPAILDEVPEQDKVLVNNVIYALYICKHPER